VAIASLRAGSECEIEDTDCVNTSFPEFFNILPYLSAKK